MQATEVPTIDRGTEGGRERTTAATSMLSKVRTLIVSLAVVSLVVVAGITAYDRIQPAHGVACTLAGSVARPAPSPQAAFELWWEHTDPVELAAGLRVDGGHPAPPQRMAFYRFGSVWIWPFAPDRFVQVDVRRIRGTDQWTVTGANPCARVRETSPGHFE